MFSLRCGPFGHPGHHLVFRWRVVRWAALVMLPLAVGACAQIAESFESSEPPRRLSEAAARIDAESEDAEFPNLASVPNQPPAVTGSDQRKSIREGLVADRANAEYTNELLPPGGMTAALEESFTPDSYSISSEPDAGTSEREAASTGSASVGDDIAPSPPEPASDTAGGGSVPPEAAPMPEVAEIPPSPASELLAPEVDSLRPSAGSGATDETRPAEPPVAGSANGAESAEEPAAVRELAEPEVEPESEPEPAAEIAALSPGGASDVGTQILFGEGSADLSTTAQSELSSVAEQLLQNADTRVQLRAYASGDEGASSQARRLSLSRAVAVRRFLIEQGVSSTRMDVRALGNQAKENPADRVDIVVADR